MRRTGSPYPRATTRVAQLVDQDGQVEQNHEGGGHHVPGVLPCRVAARLLA